MKWLLMFKFLLQDTRSMMYIIIECVCCQNNSWHRPAVTDSHVCMHNMWYKLVQLKVENILNILTATGFMSCYSSHSLDSRVTHGANNVHLFHPFHNRRYVLLLELQVPLVLFNNTHFCGTENRKLDLKHLNPAGITVSNHFQIFPGHSFYFLESALTE